ADIDGSSKVIPVKYNAKKGEYSSKLLSAEDIKLMTNRIGDIVTENTKKIFDCKFPVSPVNAEKPACEYCDYRKICGFDIRRPDCHYRQIKQVADKDIVWGKNE
ncbi:MAG: hypothetical protein J7L77_02785, partial [Clostridiales bacterium]|nr:hypothetical protein [Clostridiales bacterium]